MSLSVQEDRHSGFGKPPCQKWLKRCNTVLGLSPQASGVVSLFLILSTYAKKNAQKFSSCLPFLQVMPKDKGANFVFCVASWVKKERCYTIDGHLWELLCCIWLKSLLSLVYSLLQSCVCSPFIMFLCLNIFQNK